MSNIKTRRDLFRKAAVVLLIAVVAIQAAVIYYTVTEKKNFQGTQSHKVDSIIRPRINASAQYPSQFSQRQTQINPQTPYRSLRPPPLPKLNLNSNMTGAKPSVQLFQQGTVQPRRTTLSRQIPSFGMNGMMMGGMNVDIQKEFERMQKRMNSMFSNHSMSTAMKRHANARGLSRKPVGSSLSEKGNNFVVKLTMPGLDKSHINAEVNSNILTLSGVQKNEVEEKSKYGRSYSSSYSSFRNSFSLPGPIKSEGMKIYYKNNILTVIVPKA